MTRDAQATWMPSPFYTAGRNGYRPRYIILHGTAGGSSALAIATWFRNPQAQAASHYIIGPDGLIVQCVDENDWAWANGTVSAGHDPWWQADINPNWITISIEHVNGDEWNRNALTQKQIQTSIALTKRIATRWGIPLQPATALGGITGHYSIDPVNRSSCPGNYPWGTLWDALKGGDEEMLQPTDPFALSFFENFTPDRWHCKTTNVDVAYGILNYYRTLGGQLRLPLSPEFQIVPQVTAQAFEGGIVVYDPAHKLDNPPNAIGNCYMAHIDKGPAQQIIAQPLITSLNAQIQALQTRITQLTSSGDAAALQQQIATLHQQIQALSAKLAQINTLSKVS